ncbi:hypothetical protein [Coraliomargarita parva]|uniref:hypothetical protein n=1 Tax=Coraliomargarita parva TaxID=3014050 RepID=UPI0022B51934|nr:hypothetical protein [Coraliomargarita parva]
MSPKNYFTSFLVLASSLLLIPGCRESRQAPDNLKVPRLMVETRGVQYGALTGDQVRLPVSGSSIQLQKDPLVNEFQIFNVELVKVELGMALLIQTSETGARELYRGTVTNMGGRIVLTVNGNAIGARRIDGAIQDGNFYTFVEVPEDELGELVMDLRDSIVYLQQNKP